MKPALEFGRLHDATLLSLSVNWKRRSAEIRLITPTSPSLSRRYRRPGLTHFDVPRLTPWGESASINTAVVQSSQGAKTKRLSVEMQSGDVIEVDADEFVLVYADDPEPVR